MLQRGKKRLKRLFNALGVDVRWHVRRPRHALATLLDLYGVDMIFDVGANAGSSGEYLRNIGFAGDIVSFEPVKELFVQLQRRARTDPRWRCENLALGDTQGEGVIHVSGVGGVFSSFLPMTDELTARAPELRATSHESVSISTIDGVMARHYPRGDRLFLKLDVQGYERQVLQGAQESISRIVGMRVEVSVVESYAEEVLIYEMLPFLYRLGYRLTSIEHVWSNEITQEVYQLDATMFRTDKVSGPTRRDLTSG